MRGDRVTDAIEAELTRSQEDESPRRI